MKRAADLNFEKAAELRDRLHAMSQVSGASGSINPTTFGEGDVIAIHSEGGQSCVQVFFFRAGQNWGNNSYFPRHTKEDDIADVIDA